MMSNLIMLSLSALQFVSTNPEHTNGSAKIDTDGSIESDCASISSKEADEKVHQKAYFVCFSL